MVLHVAVKCVIYIKLKIMKQIIAAAAISILLFSGCKPKVKKAEEKAIVAAAANAVVNYTQLLGSYVGDFGTNKITLLITKAINDVVEGRTIVGGNDRPFAGQVKLADGKYSITAKEPGDDKNDGIFEIQVDEKNSGLLTGTWKPANVNTTVQPKAFSLQRRAFTYLKGAGQYPLASNKILTEDDVANLMKEELEMMRNEIFARHGYCFKKKDLREQFEDKDWYIPHTTDVRTELTDIEKKNIALIKRYEKYAEENGDDFGR
jgi:YARHG domain